MVNNDLDEIHRVALRGEETHVFKLEPIMQHDLILHGAPRSWWHVYYSYSRLARRIWGYSRSAE